MDTIPFTEFVDINPPVDFRRLGDKTRVSFIPMSDVSENGQWNIRQERELDQVRSGYTPFCEGDLLFAKITPCMENGKGAHAIGLRNGIGFGSTEFYVLRAKEENSPRFLYHWLQSAGVRQQAIAFMGGSAGQQRVRSEFFNKLHIPYLAPAEQQRIATILDTVDEAIAKTEAVIAKLRQMRAGLLHGLLTRGLDEQGNLRPHAQEAPRLYKETPLGCIPQGWSYEPVGAFVLSSAFGPRFSSTAYSDDGNIATLRTTDMDDEGNINFASMPLARLDLRVMNSHLLQIGDLLITRSGTIGVTSVFPGYTLPVIPGAFSIRFRFDDRVQPTYLQFFFNSPGGRMLLLNEAQGGVQKNITGTAIERIKIPIPPQNEQEGICAKVDSVNEWIEYETSNLDKLRYIKSGLTSDLLTGRVPTDLIR